MNTRIIFFCLFNLWNTLLLVSQNAITVTKWIGGVSIPVDITNCGDDRVFVVEKTGRIKIVENNKLIATPFLDIISKVRSSGNEQGLLGLAFHPDYSNNGYFYVNYTNKTTPTLTIIERYQVTSNKNRADSTSGTILLSFIQPYANHNGGCLKFGKDGYLYIGTGDGGSGNDPQNYAQNKKSMLGKMLRIDVDTVAGYKIPTSNPFLKDTNYLPEIWSIGLRNPWRYSFDKETGDLWIGDVGQGNWEEIDFESINSLGGRNYGWRCYEGNKDFNLSGCVAKSNYTFPLHEYFSDENLEGCSVTGGYVYRGKKYPSLFGKYIYGDYCSGKIWMLNRINNNMYTNKQVYDYSNNALTTFGEDAEGSLYFADAMTSSIYKIGDTCKFTFKIISTNPTCPGDADGTAKTDLKDGIGAKFKWSTGDTVSMLNNLQSGIYSVEVLYNQCLTEIQFEIINKSADTACIQTPNKTAFCTSDSLELIACEHPNILSYKWLKDGVARNDLSGRRVWIKEPGSYQVSFTDSTGCNTIGSEAIQIDVHPIPAAPTLKLQKDTLIASMNFNSYRWYLDGNFIGSGSENYWIAVMEGQYQVEGVDSNQCHSVLSSPVLYLRVKSENFNKTTNIFKVHPNPVSDILVIETKQNKLISKLKFQIISMQNREIRTNYIANFKNTSSIDVSDLSSGMYWIRIQSEGKEEKLAFIKVKN